jgi:hypothetical protein
VEQAYLKRGGKMLRRLLVIAAAAAIMVFCVDGCKKSPDEDETGAGAKAPTIEDYRAEAEKEITRENMAAELDRLEKEIEQDISEGQ